MSEIHYEESGAKCSNSDYINDLEEENTILREAVESISKNTCCESCQEAKLVAKQALEKIKRGGE